MINEHRDRLSTISKPRNAKPKILTELVKIGIARHEEELSVDVVGTIILPRWTAGCNRGNVAISMTHSLHRGVLFSI